jgi:alkanesulfonate monooxygenase SsuD/methylene tetrahydromethanopterin reductase-like flavin-dependent oxidoreductase (luciferase family)
MPYMRFGVEVVPFGDNARPQTIVELARAAERAGWEALFVWDHLAFAWHGYRGSFDTLLERVEAGPHPLH